LDGTSGAGPQHRDNAMIRHSPVKDRPVSNYYSPF
jgi:hypothetical protein